MTRAELVAGFVVVAEGRAAGTLPLCRYTVQGQGRDAPRAPDRRTLPAHAPELAYRAGSSGAAVRFGHNRKGAR